MGYTTIEEHSAVELTERTWDDIIEEHSPVEPIERTWGDIRHRREECGADMLLVTGAPPGDLPALTTTGDWMSCTVDNTCSHLWLAWNQRVWENCGGNRTNLE